MTEKLEAGFEGLVSLQIAENTTTQHLRLPPGWTERTCEYWQSVAQESREVPGEDQETAQERRWFERTGVRAEDTHFTISVPIHNEQAMLPSFLASLSQVDIPTSARITTVFVTNGCRDNSGGMVDEYMSGFGPVQERPLTEPSDLFEDGLPDPRLDAQYRIVEYRNWRFIHLDTALGDKPNALNVVNSIASGKDPIVINIDVDSFVEPDAIAHLYGLAFSAFVRNPDNVLVVYGKQVKAANQPRFDLSQGLGVYIPVPHLIRDLIPSAESPVIKVKGYFHAWCPEVMARVGGLPREEPDDWVNDLVAARTGMQTLEAAEARVWTTSSQTFEARRSVLVRRFRGIRQIINTYPELGELAQREFFLMRSPEERRQLICSWIRRDGMAMELLPYIEQLWDGIIIEGVQENSMPPWHRIEGSR